MRKLHVWITLGVLLCVILVNTGYLIFEELKDKPAFNNAEREIANWLDKSQGDFIVYTADNGLKTFPFIFGNRLYLYDIKHDKRFLVKNQSRPFCSFGERICFLEDDILIENGMGMGEPPSDVITVSLDGNITEFNIDPVYCMALSKSEIYFLNENIYKINRSSKKQEMVLQQNGKPFDRFKIFDENMIAFDENGDCIIVKNLDAQKVTEVTVPKNHTILDAVMGKDEKVILFCKRDRINQMDIFSVDLGTQACTCITTQNTVKEIVNSEINAFCYDKETVLFCDFDGNVAKLNLSNGSTSVLIDQPKLEKKFEVSSVSYAENYIVI